MILAIEDILSEAVSRKIITTIRPDIQIYNAIGNEGRGYLEKRARSLNQMAVSVPVFILADIDNLTDCPVELRRQWLGGEPHAFMLLRFAVTEVESWILADRNNIATYLAVSERMIPNDTDAILQPKEHIILLARHSRQRSVKTDMVPKPGSTAKVGPAYNSRMLDFIMNHWDVNNAENYSPSLRKTVSRIRTFSQEKR